MNPLYDMIINQQYVNHGYLQQLRQQQYYVEQVQEIEKAVKALKDYCEAVKSIAPEYRQIALRECIAVLLSEMEAK